MTEVAQELLAHAVRADNGCLINTRGTNLNGYRRVGVAGAEVLAHRIIWQHFHGVTLPPEMTVDHSCHNKAVEGDGCVNGPQCPHRACIEPEHLGVAEAVENWRRGSRGAPRLRSLKPDCPQGHPYSGSNLYIIPSTGGRSCRRCHRDRERERRKRQREQRQQIRRQL